MKKMGDKSRMKVILLTVWYIFRPLYILFILLYHHHVCDHQQRP